MAPKPKPTKTLNPLHFEDLDPKRFEDLVRRLLYGFREWDSIEPTGRGGADDGFDVRAWDRTNAITNVDDDGEEGARALDSNVWQIQSKREKSITPAKMRAIIRDGVAGDSPPYGYILAAATNISKATYDVFRSELRAKGVREFYFWGKDYLEDQLSLPGNDEILFTFFGISLSARRRSRTTEVKFAVNSKNKLLRLIFGTEKLHGQSVPRSTTFVLRDIKADHYPDETAYPDFAVNRRWEEHDVVEVGPRGLYFKTRERYAYLDEAAKEWDFSPAVDLTLRKHNIDSSNQARLEEEGRRAERCWRHLPLRVQAKLMVYGFLPFEEILIIDDRGDTLRTDPHLYVDFGPAGPFHHMIVNLVHHQRALREDELSAMTQVPHFPKRSPEPTNGTVHEVDGLGLPPDVARGVGHLRGATTVYAVGGPMTTLVVGDLIRSPAADRQSMDQYAEVTYLRKTSVDAVVKEQGEYYRSRISNSAGRDLADSDEVLAVELHAVFYRSDGDQPPAYLDVPW